MASAVVAGRFGGGIGHPRLRRGSWAPPTLLGAAMMDSDGKFSDALERWLESDAPKSLGALGDVFAEKSFAVAIVVLMLASATPVPTGGIALMFQIVAAALAAQMVLGRRTIWLPERWRRRELGVMITGKANPVHRASGPQAREALSPTLDSSLPSARVHPVDRLVADRVRDRRRLGASVDGPRDTAIDGAVVVALAIILEDVVVLVIGVAIGTGGIVLFAFVGAALIRLIRGVL